MFLGRNEEAVSAATAPTDVNGVCDTVLANLGVSQQDPVSASTSGSYTIPKDMYATVSVASYPNSMSSTKITVSVYQDEVLLHSTTDFGTRKFAVTINFSGFFKKGAVLRLSVSSPNYSHRSTMTIKGSPYFIYRLTE